MYIAYAGCLLKCYDAGDMRFMQGIIGLFAKQVKRPEPELVTERLIDRVDQICRERRPRLHQNRREDGQAKVEQHEQVEYRQIMPGNPEHDAVATAESLAALNTVVMIFATQLIQLTATIGGRTNSHGQLLDRKSTRLNSSHSQISYAVFC